MTAPSTALGRYCIGSVKKSRTSAIVAVAVKPAIWVRAPVWALTEARDPLAPSGTRASRRPRGLQVAHRHAYWRAMCIFSSASGSLISSPLRSTVTV